MKKSILVFLVIIGCLIKSNSNSLATPINIGMATYGGYEYSLFWDDDTSLIWIDSHNSWETWGNQKAIFRNLNPVFNIYPSYQVNWGVSEWRLPEINEISDFFSKDISVFSEVFTNMRYWSNTSSSYFKAWTILRGDEKEYRKKSRAFALTVYDRAQVIINAPVPGADPIPEPATIILFTVGFIGLIVKKNM